MGEGSFVMTELGSSTVLHSLTAVFSEEGKYVIYLLMHFSEYKIPEHKSSRRDFTLGVPSLRFQAH